MSSPTPIPCTDKDIIESDCGVRDPLAAKKTTLQTPSLNPISSPFARNEIANDTNGMLVGPSLMALKSQPRLRISRQVIQPHLHSQEVQSPSTKRSRVEEKEDAVHTLSSMCAKNRAQSTNHDSPKPRNMYDGRTKHTLQSVSYKNDDDTSHDTHSVTEQLEIRSHSSPLSTNGSAAERTVPTVRAERAGSDGDLPCRNPPMKRAKIAMTNEVDILIRIPTSQTQKTSPKETPLTVTDTNSHITQNNTAKLIPSSTEIEKNNLSSMAVLQVSDTNAAVANSSTTESSSSSFSASTTTPASATIPSEGIISENMNAVGKVEKNSLPPLTKSQRQIKSENDKNTTAATANTILQAHAPSPTTKKELNQPKKLNANKAISKGKLLENSVESKKTVVKESAESSKKPETSAMCLVNNMQVQQAVSSVSPPPPTFPIKAAANSGVEVNKNPSAISSTPAISTSTKKKKSSGSKRKRSGSSGSSSSQKAKGQSSGRWTQGEHQAFLEGLTECGREWKKVALRIPTRTSAQIRSHAQKYFAKLQRDQESSATNANVGMVHGDLLSPLTPVGTGLVVGVGGLSGTIITAPGAAALAPSVRRNVERIVANPRAAQREVEDTMEKLRERYRQLQQRLEERRRNREEGKKSRLDKQLQSQPLSTTSSKTGASSEVSAFASPPSIPQKPKQTNSLSRKRMPLPINHRNHDTKESDVPGRSSTPAGDENSSVCSNVSSIAASRTDLGNEEIIALQVLGDALPRSESVNDLHVLGSDVFQGRGDSSIEADGTMPSMNDNISSSSYDKLAPLPGVENDNDSLMNQGASVTTNENNIPSGADAATSGSISVCGISALGDPTSVGTNATAAT